MPPPPEQLHSLPCWHIPNFVLKIEDLHHEGASIFLENVKPREALKIAVEASYTWLYTPLTAPRQYVHVVSHLMSLEKALMLLCAQASRPSRSSCDHSMVWRTRLAHMRTRKSISPSTTLRALLLELAMKLLVYSSTRLCTATNKMLSTHVLTDSSKA